MLRRDESILFYTFIFTYKLFHILLSCFYLKNVDLFILL